MPGRRIAEVHPDVIRLGPFTEEIHEAYRICRTAKSIDARVTTVFGVPHASALPERTLHECADLDFVVCGEGEATLLDLVERADPAHVQGAAYRRDGEIVVNQSRDQIADADSLPCPAWDLLPLDACRGILTPHLHEKINPPALEPAILSARGRPYRCDFCSKTYRGLRNHDPVKVVDELEYDMRTFGASEFFFVEGTFAAERAQGLRRG
jgi:anaerobic magnesium-protoporphyrin IX monomethyl ester cyclase